MSNNVRPFHTLLVANRGEIALRIMRTARRLGLGTVAIYSEADRNSPHVRYADSAVLVGEAAPRTSYLNIESIIKAALTSGADAVHPGYGFLAENEDFADAVMNAGLVFVGPSSNAIRSMGNKAEAKRLMIAAGMPCIPGYQGQDQSDAALLAAATEIGFPIMVKATAGGGGRGMRLVHEASLLLSALGSARSEAMASFGSDELILERALLGPRHIEIQVFADSHGNAIHLGERDCSVQRRHQKIIEEAPSPVVGPDLRERMGNAAVHAARAIGYLGAGTMEFLLGGDGNFYFMEMNTRLQVEHAVTEAITGFDLVEWQLRVAAGEALPATQENIRLDGHAIEVRLTAEDVPAGFLPQCGPVLRWRPPGNDRGVRIDHSLNEGGTVSPHYDSMVAKLVAHGRTREEARYKLLRALQDCVLLGVANNQGFLVDCLENQAFAKGEVHTGFIDLHMQACLAGATPDAHTVACAALAATDALAQGGATLSAIARTVILVLGQRSWNTSITAIPGKGWTVNVDRLGIDGETAGAESVSLRRIEGAEEDGTLWIECNGLVRKLVYARDGVSTHLFYSGRAWHFASLDPRRARGAESGNGALVAPLTGRIINVAVEAGHVVKAGQPLVVLEAMKMEHTLVAPFAGTVVELMALVGGQARAGALLVRVQASVETKVAEELI